MGSFQLGREAAAAAALVLGLLLFVLSAPSALNIEHAVWSLGWSALLGGTLYAITRRGLILTALVVVLFGVAYSYGLGDAAAEGLARYRTQTSADDVKTGIVHVGIFLATLAVVASLATRLFAPFRSSEKPGSASWERAFLIALIAVLGLSFLVALTTGAWTMYGASRAERIGGFQFEALYGPSLFATHVVLVRVLLGTIPGMSSRAWRTAAWAALAATVVLLFMLQVRRFFIGLAVYDLLLFLAVRSRQNRGVTKTQLVAGGLALALVLGGVQYLSLAWRQSSGGFQTNDVSARISDVGEVIASADLLEEAGASTTDRLSYLWMEAASVLVAPATSGVITIADSFITQGVNVIPGLLLPSKYMYPVITCENSFLAVRLDADLPCTPVSEGYLASGTWGVILVALVWGVYLALAETLLAGGVLSTIVATLLAVVLIAVETSAFPMFLGLRAVALELAAVVPIAVVARLYLGVENTAQVRRRVVRPRTDVAM